MLFIFLFIFLFWYEHDVYCGWKNFLVVHNQTYRGFTIEVEDCEADMRKKKVRLSAWQSKCSQLKFWAGRKDLL